MTDRLTQLSPLTIASRALAAWRASTTPEQQRQHVCEARAALEQARRALYALEQRIGAAERSAP